MIPLRRLASWEGYLWDVPPSTSVSSILASRAPSFWLCPCGQSCGLWMRRSGGVVPLGRAGADDGPRTPAYQQEGANVVQRGEGGRENAHSGGALVCSDGLSTRRAVFLRPIAAVLPSSVGCGSGSGPATYSARSRRWVTGHRGSHPHPRWLNARCSTWSCRIFPDFLGAYSRGHAPP